MDLSPHLDTRHLEGTNRGCSPDSASGEKKNENTFCIFLIKQYDSLNVVFTN